MPVGVNRGDKIIVEGFQTNGEIPQLNPKKKVWDKIQSELKTNESGVALWKEFSLLSVSGEKVTCSLSNCNIK